MQAMAFAVRAICGFNALLGRLFAFFALGIVLVCFTVVVMRYAFNAGSVPLQDLYIWLNGMMFMGIAGYTLMRDGHVRVDIFYRDAALRTRALIDMLGCFIFVAPFLWVIVEQGYPYVVRSWGLKEGSANVGGLQGLYVLKSFVLVFVVVVGLQAIAMVLRSALILAGREDLVPPVFRYPAEEA
ncbi:MAG: TRAP transporter small permease subunit [Rhodobacteraceae bacterium]|nr:TRAP transporter small permease subunit [Paracoccaceae bacterium]